MDVVRLKEKMGQKKMSVEDMALQIGIDPSTYYRKLNTQGESFTISQAKAIAAVLGLSHAEASNIFLR